MDGVWFALNQWRAAAEKCGGRWLMANRYGNFGIDFSTIAIAAARRYCRALGWPDVEFGWRQQDGCGASLRCSSGRRDEYEVRQQRQN